MRHSRWLWGGRRGERSAEACSCHCPALHLGDRFPFCSRATGESGAWSAVTVTGEPYAADSSFMLQQGNTGAAAAQFVRIAMKNDVLCAAIVCPFINERASQIIAREVNAAIRLARGRLRAVVLDMAQVQRMSSIGLGMCIDIRNSAHAVAAKTFTVSLNRELTDLFRMTRVDRLFTMMLNENELAKVLA